MRETSYGGMCCVLVPFPTPTGTWRQVAPHRYFNRRGLWGLLGEDEAAFGQETVSGPNDMAEIAWLRLTACATGRSLILLMQVLVKYHVDNTDG